MAMVLLSPARVAARSIGLVALLGVMATGASHDWHLTTPIAQRPSPVAAASNPRLLRALQLLDRRKPGVAPRNATAWESHRVAFELTLPEGFHSWSVVALFGPDEHGDFNHPTTVSF